MDLTDLDLISIINRLRRVLKGHRFLFEGSKGWVETRMTARELKVLLDAAERSLTVL